MGVARKRKKTDGEPSLLSEQVAALEDALCEKEQDFLELCDMYLELKDKYLALLAKDGKTDGEL